MQFSVELRVIPRFAGRTSFTCFRHSAPVRCCLSGSILERLLRALNLVVVELAMALSTLRCAAPFESDSVPLQSGLATPTGQVAAIRCGAAAVSDAIAATIRWRGGSRVNV